MKPRKDAEFGQYFQKVGVFFILLLFAQLQYIFVHGRIVLIKANFDLIFNNSLFFFIYLLMVFYLFIYFFFF